MKLPGFGLLRVPPASKSAAKHSTVVAQSSGVRPSWRSAVARWTHAEMDRSQHIQPSSQAPHLVSRVDRGAHSQEAANEGFGAFARRSDVEGGAPVHFGSAKGGVGIEQRGDALSCAGAVQRSTVDLNDGGRGGRCGNCTICGARQ